MGLSLCVEIVNVRIYQDIWVCMCECFSISIRWNVCIHVCMCLSIHVFKCMQARLEKKREVLREHFNC